jgi:voltage-gated potassium channel
MLSALHAVPMTAPDHRSADAGRRSERYEARTDRPLLILACCFIAVYATQVAAPSWPTRLRGLLAVASWVIWAIFATDLAVRIWLADRPARYLLTHPIDLIAVLLPALRPLRVLRVFTAG